jgi:hypothetical protein
MLGAVFSVGSTPRLHSEDPKRADKISFEGRQLSRALQGRLRKDGAIVELTVDKSSVAGYLPDSNDV